MIINYLKSWDYFGHPALMHFGRNPKKNEDGDTLIKTVIGAFYSILLRLIYLIAVVFFLRKMALAENNSLGSVDINANWEKLKEE